MIESEADKAHVVCYLESSNPRNVAFYESLGFEVKRKIRADKYNENSPILNLMLRPAK